MMDKSTQVWDRWMKIASIFATGVLIPGIGWAFKTSSELQELNGKVQMLSSQMESDRRGVTMILEEIRQMRTSVESLRADILQRMTRVETKVDTK